MWSATERDAVQMELRVAYRSRKREVRDELLPAADMAKLGRDIVDAKLDHEIRNYKGGAVKVYLRDKKIVTVGHRSFLVLLLAISDKRRPNHVLSDPTIAHRREIPREEHEGNDQSCHIAISLDSEMPGGACFRTAFEAVPLFSVMYVNRFLRHLAKHVSVLNNYDVPHPAGVQNRGVFVRVPVGVTTELHAVPSDELVRDLERGVLAEIEISKEVQGAQGFDQHAYTVDKRSTMTLKPAKNLFNVDPMEVIRSVCSSAEQRQFTVAKVKWKSGRRSLSARFECETASPLSSRYIKRHAFKLNEPLPASCDKIDDHLARAMIAWIS